MSGGTISDVATPVLALPARTSSNRYEVFAKDFGFVVATGRDIEDSETHWTANVMLMPFHKIIATDPPGAHIWAPMDDESTMLYSIDLHPDRPLDDADRERADKGEGIHTVNIDGSDYAVRNAANHYLVDRALQKSGASFTGMRGFGIQACTIQSQTFEIPLLWRSLANHRKTQLAMDSVRTKGLIV